MAVRFSTSFRNKLDVLYNIHIHDTEIEGTPVNYIAADEGFEMSQNGDDQYLYNPIIATDVSLFMHVQDSNRAAINTFLFDIVNSGDENRFTVVIYKDSLVYFRGKVHSERISIPDRHHNTITITASDGFGRLRTIPYNDSGTLYEGWETVQNHLYNVLSKLDLFGYGGYLVNSIAVATKLNVAGETSRLFENIRFQHDAVKEIKSDGTIFPLSCHDVLSQILIRFGCRIVQLNGVFHIQEFTSMAESSDISVHNYDSSGNWVSTGDLSYKISTIQKLAGGMTWFREPAKYVKVDYVYQDSLNGSNLAKEIIPFKTWVSVGEVPTGNGETVAVNFDFSVVHKANAFPTSVIYYITYKFSIRRGLSFLTNEGGTAVWQSDSSKTYNVTDLYEIDDPNDINLIHQISFIIPELPSTGDLYIYWNFSKTRSNGAALVTEPNGMDWITVLDNVLAMLYSDNLDANEGTLSTIALGSSSSGEEIDLGAVVIGDMPFERSIGRIQYYKFPSLWLNSLNDWGHDAEEELTLNQLISREILALQRKTTKIKSYIIRSKYPGAGFRLDGNVVTRATYKADSAIWEIESFEPVIDRSSVEYTQYVESDQTGSLPSGISIPTQTTTPNYWDRENNTLTTVNNGDKVEVTVTGGSNTAISGYSEYVGVYGEGDSAGVNGSGTIWGVVGEGNTGLYGEGEAYGVNGYSYEGVGVYAQSDNGTGLIGDSLTGDGISASSTGGVGLKAVGGTYDIETLTSGSVSIKSAGRVSGQDAIADNEFVTLRQLDNMTTIGSDECWTRPIDWIPMPLVVEGEQKIVALFAVYDVFVNYLTIKITCSGTFIIDWGDGTTSEHTSATIEKDLYYLDYPDSECSRGYRQALIKIIAKDEATFSLMSLQCVRSTGVDSKIVNNWLDIKMASSTITTLEIGQGSATAPIGLLSLLERFHYVGTNLLTTTRGQFKGCTALASIPEFYAEGASNAQEMFYECTSLVCAPMLKFKNQAFTAMNMFYSCRSLKNVPKINFINCNSTYQMFYGCYSLKTLPLLNFSSSQSTYRMFMYCYSLEYLPEISFLGSTAAKEMFAYCYNVKDLSKIILRTFTGTNILSMFTFCYALMTPPLFVIGTANPAGMFAQNKSMIVSPPYDFANVTDHTNIYQGCYSLARCPVVAWGQRNVSFNSCNLRLNSIIEIFEALPDLTGGTTRYIDLRGVPEVSNLTTAQREIATTKNWIIQ